MRVSRHRGVRSLCFFALVAGVGVAAGSFVGCGDDDYGTCDCPGFTDGGVVTVPPSPLPPPSGTSVTLVPPDASAPADAAPTPASCRFGASGASAPVGLVTNLSNPYGLVVRAGTLYLTDVGAGTVASIATAGGGLTVLATQQQALAGLAVDDHAVYFASVNGLSSVPLDGGAVASIVGDVSATGAVAVDATTAYFFAAEESTVGDLAIVESVPLAGGALTGLGATSQQAPWVAVGSGGVYWTTATFSEDAGTYSGSVQRQPAGGGPAQPLTAGNVVPLAVAVDGNDVFYSSDSPSISRVGADGGPSTVLATSAYDAVALAVDDENVYWVDSFVGTINCVPRSGGAATVIASGQDPPVAIAVDSAGVYWITQPPGPDSFGRLMKLAR
jgi:hypothetical protein